MSGIDNPTIQQLSMPTVESRVRYIKTKSSQSELDSQEWWRTCFTPPSVESLNAVTHEAADSVRARAAVEAERAPWC